MGRIGVGLGDTKIVAERDEAKLKAESLSESLLKKKLDPLFIFSYPILDCSQSRRDW